MNHSVRTLRFTKTLFTDSYVRFYCTEANPMKGLVLGVHCNSKQDYEFTPTAQCFNDANEGKLQSLLSLVRKSMKPGKVKLFYALNAEFKTVALVGLPKKEKAVNELENLDEFKEGVRVAASAGCRSLQDEGIEDIAIETLTDAEAAAEGAFLGTWKFQEFKSSAAKKTPPKIRNYENKQTKEWNVGRIKADCQNIARRLMDMPSNKMTPSIFANVAEKLLKPSGVEVNAYGVNWIKEQKMGAFLSVTKGSSEPAVFLEIKYKRGAEKADPIVLVGKGVTFDSGGISLKKSGAMDEMRADMGGAACVLATILAIAQLELPISVTGLIPLCENMPSGSATKPGDIVTAMNGKTIAVDNTDAEGRLILADALCYASTLKPKFTLDIATLTGAMHVAIGGAATGVFSNSSSLWNELSKAGTYSGDRVWRFPLWKFYTKQMTDFASVDINNIGKGKGGGSCTAAAFLREFAPPGDWLHLDMAGVMGPSDDTPYLHKGMTGRPVRTLTQFLTQLATHEDEK